MKFGALRICATYIVLSILWVTFSDKILYFFKPGMAAAAFVVFRDCKRVLFIIINALFLYKLVQFGDERLAASEKNYRTMYEANPLPMWIYDLKTLKILSVNSAAINDYGYTEVEFLLKTILNTKPVKEIPEILEAVNEVEKNKVKSCVWEHVKSDNELIYVNINSQQIIIDKKPHVMLIAKDITEKVLFKKKLEALNQNLLEEKMKLRDTQQLAKLAGWILYLPDKGLEWSEEVYRITDHTPKPGENLFDVYIDHIFPEDRPMMINALEALVDTDRRFDVTHRIKLHDGQVRHIHHVARLERIDGLPCKVIGSMQDITEQQEKENRIAHQNAVLQEIAWLNSHEIRGPVASILGLVQLYKDAGTQEEKENIMQMIKKCAKDLDIIVHNIAARINKELQDINYRGSYL